MDVNRIVFGAVALLVGAATAGMMLAYPEGLNPDWPLAAALVVPALFALAGVHMLAGGLGYPRFSGAMLTAIAIGMWAIANWAAFFTSGYRCVSTVSFLGVALFGKALSDEVCRLTLQALVGIIDALIVIAYLVYAWRKRRANTGEASH